MSGTVRPTPEELLLREIDSRSGPEFGPGLRGLFLRSDLGTAVFLLTKQQFLDLAEICRMNAEGMPDPS